MTDAFTPQPCPECVTGKHVNCDGETWDTIADEPTECPCASAGHQVSGAATSTPAAPDHTPADPGDAPTVTRPHPGLTILPDLVQGSPEWHDQRRGIVTASVVGQLITPSTLKPANNDTSRGLTALLVAERITGHTDPTYVNDDMWRGIEDEPRAVEKYSETYAHVDTAGFMVRDDWGFKIGYSPDGLVGNDGLIEVKSRRQKKHLQTILSDEVPAENMAQLQCGLLVSGRDWIDYLSYCGGMPMWRKRVTADLEWFAAILAAVRAFEDNAERMITAYEAATKGLPLTARPVELEMI